MTFASNVNGSLIIPAYWQSAWSAMYNVMTLVGSLVAAETVDRFGCRFGFLFTAVTAAAGIALSFVARNPPEFLGGKMITGFAVGIAMTVGQKYVSEIAPLRMRGIALSFNTICMASLPQAEAKTGPDAEHHLTLSVCPEPRLPYRHLCDVQQSQHHGGISFQSTRTLHSHTHIPMTPPAGTNFSSYHRIYSLPPGPSPVLS